MSRTFTQVPPDSTGDKLAMRSYPAGADTLHSQGVHFDGLPTYRVFADRVVPAGTKSHIYLGNNTGSAQTLFLVGLYAMNLQTGAVVGVINRFNLRRVTGTPGGSAITPYPFNSADPALANVTAQGNVNSGLTDSTIVHPFVVSTEENNAVPANVTPFLMHVNILPAINAYSRPLALRPGEAMAVRQVDAGTVGALSWIIDFAVEPD